MLEHKMMGEEMRPSGRMKSHPIFTLFQVLVLATLVVGTSGCMLLLGAGAGVGGTAYYMGKLEEEVSGSVSKVRRATVAGLKNLDMPVIRDQGDKLAAVVKSITADEKEVWININSLDASRCKISIRVGYLGDEARSRRILRAIRSQV